MNSIEQARANIAAGKMWYVVREGGRLIPKLLTTPELLNHDTVGIPYLEQWEADMWIEQNPHRTPKPTFGKIWALPLEYGDLGDD